MVVLRRSLTDHRGVAPVRHCPAMGALDGQVDRLERARDDLAALRGRVEAGAPWPLSDVFGSEPEARWGPPELLAHVAEMLPYWLGEIERIVAAGTDETVPFGRVADDPIRIAVIGRDRSLPLRALFDRIEADAGRVARRLMSLTDAEAARAGLHPTRGLTTIPGLLEFAVVGHLEGHLVQLREILEQADRLRARGPA